jgi:hypothetical protein
VTSHFPVVFEREASGVVSAYIPGLPVYAQGATKDTSATALRRTLAAYLEAHPEAAVTAAIRVARVVTATKPTRRTRVTIASPAVLLGQHRSAAKAAAARRNGRRGGRPRKSTHD